MSEKDAPEELPETDVEGWQELVSRRAAGDWLLSILVNIVDGSDTSLSVTLNVPGGVVSGMLVSRHVWLQKLAGTHELLDQLVDAVNGLLDEVSEQQTTTFSYLHLLDAQYLGGGDVVDGMLWRGRITEISGWALGMIRRNPAT